MNDHEIYNEISSILVIDAPIGTEKIILKSRLYDDNDGMEAETFYFANIEKSYLHLRVGSLSKISKLLVLLRNYFVNNNLTNGLPGWQYCWAEIDLVNNKIKFDFAYDPENREEKFIFSYE